MNTNPPRSWRHRINRIPLAWRWFFSLALLWAISLTTVNIFLRWTLPPYLNQQLDKELQRQVWMAKTAFASLLIQDGEPDTQTHHQLRELSGQTGLRITLIKANGDVILDTDKSSGIVAGIESPITRLEIRQAMVQDIGYAQRVSSAVNRPFRYAAVAVRDQGELKGFVRVAAPLEQIRDFTRRVERSVALASIVIGLLALPPVFLMTRLLTRPIAAMQNMAVRAATGDFSARVPATGGPELANLAQSLNQMSNQLSARLNELAKEKAELNATLANMIEGVLVVDTVGRIRIANRALQQLLGISDLAIGKTVMEAFRSSPLQEMINQAMSDATVSPRELSFYGDDQRVFDVNAASLRDRQGAQTGAVVVFHDITRIKQLENMRKEFVANVSHELRTPLSIIKGYVETLLDDEAPAPDISRQFLGTIARHARRLEALIGDLLTISSLESQQAQLDLGPIALRQVAASVMEELARHANARHITVLNEMPDSLPAVRGDARRIHQVLFNLLDNAVKYTQTGGHVFISAREQASEVTVCVADDGPGIAAEHLPHIFERFYRVDKARSREVGGTGLGLSIVKHIVQAHGGKVWAESDGSQKGCRFYFTLMRD